MLYAFGDYTLDTQRYELRHAGTLCKLEPQALDLLVYLLQHRDRVVTQQELLAHLWPDRYVGAGSLTQRLMMVRKTLGDSGRAQHWIKTLHGRGYRFVAAVAVHATAPGDEGVPTLADTVSPSPHHEAPRSSEPASCPAPSTLPAQAPAASSHLVLEASDGEHKQITILCCALAVPRHHIAHADPESLYRCMQACVAQAQQVMQRFDGTLIPYGSQGFLALFGAPLAQEDHARRAVLAAWELRRSLQAQPRLGEALHGQALALRMGLHTGLVIVGQSAAHPQWLYTAAADTITVATRLQRAAAPDTILLSAATWQLVQDEVDGEAGGSLEGEACPDAIPVYTVHRIARRRAGVAGRSGRPWRCFVGRARELAMLHARLERALHGAGQVLGISGEPGLGKSRLLAEFRRSVSGQPLRYCEAHCLSYGRTTPYLPVLDLLRQLCGLRDTDGPEVMTANMARHLQAAGIDPDAEAPLLLQLLDVPVPPGPWSSRSPEERRVRIFAILRQLTLHSSQQHPLLLAVENLHWIDATSEAWLASLVECLTAASILLVVTYRPGYRPPWLVQSVATQVALPRLLPADSRSVVQAVLQSTPLPEALLQTIITRAAGNPFFLEELAWAVREQRSHPEALGLPDTVQSVLAARIDHLPPVEKRLLQTAAVIGTEVAVPLLQAIAELPVEAVSQGLAHLQAAEFLYETRLCPEWVYAFKHALTHEVAYRSLLHERQRALHRRIVAGLETLYQARLAEQVERLAYHALQGEVWDKALFYYRQAGDKAMARSAFREAVACFEQALTALRHLPEQRHTQAQAIDLRYDLGNALQALGEFDRRFAYLREAETLAEALGDQRRLGQICTDLTHSFWTMGDHDNALTCSQRALTLAAAIGDAIQQARVHGYLGTVHFSLGDYRRAIDVFRQTIQSYEGESRHERFRSMMIISARDRLWLLQCCAELGAFVEGSAYGEEAARIAETAGHFGSAVMAQDRLGLLAFHKGDLQHAIVRLEHALAQCRTADIPLYLPAIMATLGLAYMRSGQVTEALHLFDQVEVRQTTGGGGDRIMLHLGEGYLLAGRMEEAHRLAERVLALCRDRKERGNQAWTLWLSGEVAAQRQPSDAEQAEAHYRQALALAEELGMRPLQAHCHAGLGTLYTTTGHWEQARTALAAAIALYRAMETTFWLPRMEATLAQVLHATGSLGVKH